MPSITFAVNSIVLNNIEQKWTEAQSKHVDMDEMNSIKMLSKQVKKRIYLLVYLQNDVRK